MPNKQSKETDGDNTILGESNYATWEALAKADLEAQNLWYTVCMGETPAQHEQAHKTAVGALELELQMSGKKISWAEDPALRLVVAAGRLQQDVKKARKMLLGALSSSNLARVKHIDSPHMIWGTLLHKFNSQSAENILLLTSRLSQIVLSSRSMGTYLMEKREAFDRLVAAGGTMTEKGFCLVVLDGLGDQFETYAVILRSMEKLGWQQVETTLTTAYDLKQDKKKQKPTEEKEAYESPQVAMLVRTVQSLTNELAAMKVSTSGGGRNNNSNRNRNRHDNCSHCGKPNHNEAECWTKFPAKYQEFLQKKNSKA
jgi:hypothetical protein